MSPLHLLPRLDSPQMAAARRRELRIPGEQAVKHFVSYAFRPSRAWEVNLQRFFWQRERTNRGCLSHAVL
jgi:hypothetical protein